MFNYNFRLDETSLTWIKIGVAYSNSFVRTKIWNTHWSVFALVKFSFQKKKKTQNPKRRARPHLAFTLVSHPCSISLSIFNFHCIIFELSVHWYQFFSPNQFSSYVICPRDRPNFPGEEEHLQKQDYPQQQEKR